MTVVDQVAGKLDDLLEGGRTRKDHNADMGGDERDGTKAGDETDDLASRSQGGEGFFFVHGRRLVRILSRRIPFAFKANRLLVEPYHRVTLLVDLLAGANGGNVHLHAGGTEDIIGNPRDAVTLGGRAAAGAMVGPRQLAVAVLLGLGGNGLSRNRLGPGNAGGHIFHG